jgi:hypothetical protein
MSTSANQLRQTASHLLNLIVAPLAISLLAIIITNLTIAQTTTSPWLWGITIIVSILAILMYIIGYRQGFEALLSKIAQGLRAKKFSKPRVLVLDGTINGDRREAPPTPMHTDKTPTDWRTALEALEWEVKLGTSQQISTSPIPDIVVNPFGEVYPEVDFISSSSITEIRNYVWSGGVYVNVAGIPFWYRYNPSSGTSETAGRIEKLSEERPIWKSLFSDLFPNLTPSTEPQIVECIQTQEDINRFNDCTNAGGRNTVGIFRAYPLQPAQLIPMLRDREQHCIIGSFLYGQGCFLFAGVFIDRENLSFEKVLAAIKGWASYEAKNRKP